MHRFSYLVLFLIGTLQQCSSDTPPPKESVSHPLAAENILVLGIAQDAGYPQAGCQKDCCVQNYEGKLAKQKVSCISIVDTVSQSYWIIDATPDFKEQLQILQHNHPTYTFGGIFLTHAHVGHYTGLMHLGREIMGTSDIPVYAMPKMKVFLENNGPWSQLVNLNNINLIELKDEEIIRLNNRISIAPFIVPHRDEFSETVGFKIIGSNKSALFIPDIDKWEKWSKDIKQEIATTDHALIDGTFFENGEIPGRDMSLIPHPFMEESIALFNNLNEMERSKISFIHFNHTNPVLNPNSKAYQSVINSNMNVAYEGMTIRL